MKSATSPLISSDRIFVDPPKKKCSIIAVITLCLMTMGLTSCTENLTSSAKPTQPAPNRETPYGALNSFWQAIENSNTAIAVDSIELPDNSTLEDANNRQVLIDGLMADAKLFNTATARFGRDGAVLICGECGIPIEQPPRTFAPDDFQTSSQRSDIVFGTMNPGGTAPPMHRGPDGIWRLTTRLNRVRMQAEVDREQENSSLTEALIEAINTGQYSSPDALIEAMSSKALSSMDKQPGQMLITHPPAAEKKHDPVTEKFDRSIVQGAIGAYFQAFTKGEKSGITDFFYSDGDSDGKLVHAHAAKILSTLHLRDAVDQKFQVHNYDDFILAVGLSARDDMPWFGSPGKEQGDRATIQFEDNSELPCRKIDGVWKLDITPAQPHTLGEVTNDLVHDSRILDQITAGVVAGNYKKLSEVRDALISANIVGKRTEN